jgi:3-dehydroquinate dehydratase-2
VKIAVVNGPNLNLLGTREPALYGRETLDDIERSLRSVANEIGVELQFAQHNGEES